MDMTEIITTIVKCKLRKVLKNSQDNILEGGMQRKWSQIDYDLPKSKTGSAARGTTLQQQTRQWFFKLKEVARDF